MPQAQTKVSVKQGVHLATQIALGTLVLSAFGLAFTFNEMFSRGAAGVIQTPIKNEQPFVIAGIDLSAARGSLGSNTLYASWELPVYDNSARAFFLVDHAKPIIAYEVTHVPGGYMNHMYNDGRIKLDPYECSSDLDPGSGIFTGYRLTVECSSTYPLFGPPSLNPITATSSARLDYIYKNN